MADVMCTTRAVSKKHYTQNTENALVQYVFIKTIDSKTKNATPLGNTVQEWESEDRAAAVEEMMAEKLQLETRSTMMWCLMLKDPPQECNRI